MAKDPAFLFYYDRFISGTYTMTDEQVGQYIRLLCIQANKGYVSESHMKNICKTYDKDVISKFVDTGGGKYVNEVLASIMEKRMAYTESRRNNRKGKNFNEDMNNISETYDKHMVNVNKNVNKDKNKEGGVGEGYTGEMIAAYREMRPGSSVDENDKPHLRIIYEFLEGKIKETGKQPERNEIIDLFRFIASKIESAKELNFYKTKQISTIANQIKTIYDTIKNQKNGARITSESIDAYIEANKLK